MKISTIANIVGGCFLGGAFLFGAYQCNKKETPAQKPEPSQQIAEEKPVSKDTLEEFVINKEENPEIAKEGDTRIGSPKENPKIYTKEGYYALYFYARPELKTGQSLDVLASLWEEDNFWQVRELRLYEDDKLILKEEGESSTSIECIHTIITHKEPGIHSYYAEFTYINGKTVKTETKTVEFTGEILDVPPTNARISHFKHFPMFTLEANDYGDNKGIVHYKIYEDGEILKEEDCEPTNWVFKQEKIPNRRGEHEYYAEFTDKGGNVTKTETIIVNYY